MKKTLLIISIAILSASVQGAGIKFKDADKNKDGFLTKKEFVDEQIAKNKGEAKTYNTWFARKDTNKDGKMSPKELETKPARNNKAKSKK